MSRRKKEQAGEKPVTASQLAQIHLLLNKNSRLSQQAIRSISLVTSIIMVYSLFILLTRSKISPLHSWYTSYINKQTDLVFNDIVLKLESYAKYQMKTNNLFQSFLDHVDKLRHICAKTLPHASCDTLPQAKMIKKFETYLLGNKDFESIKFLKSNYLEVYNNCIPKKLFTNSCSQIITKEDIELLTLHETVEVLTTSLRTEIDEQILDHELLARKVARVVNEQHLNTEMFFLGSIFSVLLQTFIIDPQLNRFITADIHQYQNNQHKTWISYEKARQIIEELEQKNAKRQSYARYSIYTSRFIYLIVFPIFLYLSKMISNNAADIGLLSFLLAGVVISDFRKEIYAWIEKRYLLDSLKKQKTTLLETAQNPCLKIQIIQGDNLKSSCLVLQFEDNEELSGEKQMQLLKNCLAAYNINLLSFDENKIFFPADIRLNDKVIQDIKNLFSTNMERTIAIRKLRSQIEKLLEYIWEKQRNFQFSLRQFLDSNMLSLAQSDQKNLVVELIEFKWPPIKHHIELIKESFSGNLVTITENDEQYVISIEGFSPLNDKTFKNLQSQLTKTEIVNNNNSGLQTQRFLDYETEKSVDESYLYLRKKKNDKEEHKTSAQKIIAENTKRRKDFQDEPDSLQRFPVLIGKQFNFAALKKTRHFVRNELTQADISERLWKKIQTYTECPRFVPRKGHEGLVLTRSYARDQSGKWFKTSAKLKFLGEYGDVRVYLEPKLEREGEVTHVLKGISYKSHP